MAICKHCKYSWFYAKWDNDTLIHYARCYAPVGEPKLNPIYGGKHHAIVDCSMRNKNGKCKYYKPSLFSRIFGEE